MMMFLEDSFTVIAGPCTIDSKEQLFRTAEALSALGIRYLRGGAFKMRTCPDSWQGLGEEGVKILSAAGKQFDMKTVSEIISINEIEMMSNYVDILLVGTRNMQNYPLLIELGRMDKPVILKRGMGSTIKEWLSAAEYIIKAGNEQVILCERGIRTFESYTRNTLDISAVPAIKSISRLPIIVDPSHATGRIEMIKSMTWAAAAAGADGVMIECDVFPEQMRCDSQQTIDIKQLTEILEKLPQIIDLWQKK